MKFAKQRLPKKLTRVAVAKWSMWRNGRVKRTADEDRKIVEMMKELFERCK